MSTTARDQVAAALGEAVRAAAADLGWGLPEGVVEIERPGDPRHGDYATSVALRLAKPLRKAPLEIAEAIRARVAIGGPIAAVEVARPGFVNVRLAPDWLARQVGAIVAAGTGYGRSSRLARKRIQVEFVSANPTGPMHVGNARGGPLGDVVANVLAFAGADVSREYYVNDSGNQVEVFGRTLAVRYRELGGESGLEIPEGGYAAPYVIDLARRIRDEEGARYDGLPLEEQARALAPRAIGMLVAEHRSVAERFGIHFDNFTYETSLRSSGYFEETVAELRRLGQVEDRDGAVWFRSRELGEDIDSVLIRSNGLPTYFGIDVAYHRQVLAGLDFDQKIDIWGANTHGHARRMKLAMGALDLGDKWQVVIYQFVKFLHEGVLVKMGKRTGQFLLLEDLLDAVGVDAARFFLLMSGADRGLDFDFELAVQQSNENPVYYVQYAHARIASVFRNARDAGIGWDDADLRLLDEPGTLDLVRACLRFPELVADLATSLQVHQLTGYAMELAGLFHPWYKANRVLGDDLAKTKARLRLIEAVAVTLRQTLSLLGVGAPEHM
ncbi:MAG: arginine--tRNA ligase [Candidatus Limnocylindria bacterium]|nr:arginine--tRNA ligase [Candidatus Limnocylindria bacterium]